MKPNIALTCVLLGTFLGSSAVLADVDASSTGAHAAAYVKDSAITTKIKTKFAAKHLSSLDRIHVDTDTNGVVWLSGSVGSREAIQKAISIARHTDGVKAVHATLQSTLATDGIEFRGHFSIAPAQFGAQPLKAGWARGYQIALIYLNGETCDCCVQFARKRMALDED